MAEINVIFIYEGNNMIIQGKKEEKMKEICKRYSTKLGINTKLLDFLYDGKQINLELTYNEINKSNDEMIILVIKKEIEGLICPKCGKNIIINKEQIDEIKINMNNIKEKINGIKTIIDNAISNSLIEENDIQLKNINLLLNNVNEDLNKNNEKITNIIKDNTSDNNYKNKNIIRGLLYINTYEINKDIVLFNTDMNNNIDVYINNKKVDIIKDDNEWKYKFLKEGNYIFEIIFNNNINNMNGFFGECSNIINLDLSNFNTSNVNDMSYMFFECNKLKEIKKIMKK